MTCNAKCKMQNANRTRLHCAVVLHLAFCLLNYALPAQAQIGRQIAEVVVEQEGRPVVDPVITGLIETRVGSPLDAKAVRETISHLMSLNRFDDVQVLAEEVSEGVRVRYVLTPLHPIDRIEFKGTLGLSEEGLLRVVVDRFGSLLVLEFFAAGMYRQREVIQAALVKHFPDARFYWFAEEHVGKQESFDCRSPEPPPWLSPEAPAVRRSSTRVHGRGAAPGGPKSSAHRAATRSQVSRCSAIRLGNSAR